MMEYVQKSLRRGIPAKMNPSRRHRKGGGEVRRDQIMAGLEEKVGGKPAISWHRFDPGKISVIIAGVSFSADGGWFRRRRMI